jgi:hypothetical protein
MADKKIPGVPSIAKAAVMANMLDRLGLYEDAELFDSFIEVAAVSNQDLQKVAGMWSNVWNRLKGRTKRIFLKEYRNAYNSAKSIQTQLSDRMDKLNDKYEQVAQLFKTYQLPQWYETLSQFKDVGGDKLLAESDFQKEYGRFMKSILGVKEEGAEEEGDEERPEKPKSDVEKVFGPGEQEEDVDKIDPWNVVYDKQKQGVAVHFEGDQIRIKMPLWLRWKRSRQFIRVPNPSGEDQETFQFNVKAKGRIPENLQHAMQDNIWKIDMIDKTNGYVYLGKVAPVETKEETSKAPEAPKEEFTPPPVPKVPITSPEEEGTPGILEEMEEIEREVESEKEIPEAASVEEEEKERAETEAITEAEPGPVTKAPEGTTWIQYTDGTRKKQLVGKFYPVRKVNPRIHEVVSDEGLIEKLDRAWALKHSEGAEADDILAHSASCSTRAQRIERIIHLDSRK